MRKLRIDFTSENILPDGCITGRIGEHNATTLVITPPAEMTACENVTNLCTAFMTGAGVIHSEVMPKAENLQISLWRQLTQYSGLAVQLEAYDDNGDLVVKSPVVSLRLLPSLGGKGIEVDTDNPDFVSVFLKTKHSHENKETLDKFGEDENGNPLFNGESIKSSGSDTGLTDEQATALASVLEARHTHINKNILDLIGMNYAGTRPTFNGDNNILATQQDVTSRLVEYAFKVKVPNSATVDGSTLKMQRTDGRKTTDLFEVELPKSDYINVKDYGATGDGVTDDTAAIKTAVEAVPENGTLYFPVGVYRVDNIMLKSNMIVKGDGKGSIIKLNDNAPLTNVEEYDDYWNNCFTVYQISNVTIENIALDGNKENNSATGTSKDYRLNGVIIQESTDIILHRIYAYNNGYHGCIMNVVERVEISDSEFTGNGFRPFHGHGTILDCKFINNRCICNGLGVTGDTNASAYDGIFFFDNCQRLLIQGNYIETNSTAGIDLGGSVLGDGSDTSEYKASSNIIVANNIIKKSPTTTQTPHGIQLIPANIDKVTIEGNTVIDCRSGVYGQSSSYSPLDSYINICNNIFRTTLGVFFEMPMPFANISNNQFIDYTECGIKIAGATDTQITGNTFKPNGPWTSAEGKDCVWLNNCKRTIIANNKFFNRVAGHYSQHGVKENGSTDATLIIGNTFQDMAVAAYSLIGANSKAINNIVNGIFEAEQTA